MGRRSRLILSGWLIFLTLFSLSLFYYSVNLHLSNQKSGGDIPKSSFLRKVMTDAFRSDHVELMDNVQDTMNNLPKQGDIQGPIDDVNDDVNENDKDDVKGDTKNNDENSGPKQNFKETTERPHIIFILMDDMGFNDAGYQGAEFPTKHIDALAYSGLILSNYYVHYVCSPTRAALMTGRIGSTEAGTYQPVFFRSTGDGLRPSWKVISEEFQDIGYNTHMIGKWHLGYPTFDHTPTFRGFDTFFGILGPRISYYTHDDLCPVLDAQEFICNGNHWVKDNRRVNMGGYNWGTDLWDGVTHVADDYKHKYITEVFTKKTIEKITEHKNGNLDDPMFILLSYTAPHDPWQAPYDYIDSDACRHIPENGRRVLCAMLQVVDVGIGQIIDKLKDVGYADNTNIIFSSDNGASITRKFILHQTDPKGSNYPLRGGKATYWDGGQKVIGFVWGEEFRSDCISEYNSIIEKPVTDVSRGANKIIKDGLIFVTDWYLTMLALAKSNDIDAFRKTLVEANESLDLVSGYNMLHYLQGRNQCPREYLFYGNEIRGDKGAVRNAHYKLGFNMAPTIGWTNPQNISHFSCENMMGEGNCDPVERGKFFFRISDDPSETLPLDTTKLNEEEQKNYNELKKRYDEWKKIRLEQIEPVVGNFSIRSAEMIPRFWDCKWVPWISTEANPVKTVTKCDDEPPDISLDDLPCVGPWETKWQQFSVVGSKIDPKRDIEKNDENVESCVIKFYKSTDLTGEDRELKADLNTNVTLKQSDFHSKSGGHFKSMKVGPRCRITFVNWKRSFDQGNYWNFFLRGVSQHFTGDNAVVVGNVIVEGL